MPRIIWIISSFRNSEESGSQDVIRTRGLSLNNPIVEDILTWLDGLPNNSRYWIMLKIH